jgi:hypothetical protein
MKNKLRIIPVYDGEFHKNTLQVDLYELLEYLDNNTIVVNSCGGTYLINFVESLIKIGEGK